MSITPSKQTSVYRQVDAIMKTEDIYGGDKYCCSASKLLLK